MEDRYCPGVGCAACSTRREPALGINVDCCPVSQRTVSNVPETATTSPRRGGAPTFSDSTTMRSPRFMASISCSLPPAQDTPRCKRRTPRETVRRHLTCPGCTARRIVPKSGGCGPACSTTFSLTSRSRALRGSSPCAPTSSRQIDFLLTAGSSSAAVRSAPRPNRGSDRASWSGSSHHALRGLGWKSLLAALWSKVTPCGRKNESRRSAKTGGK